jgi:probable HAF family extracellular repeat protein
MSALFWPRRTTARFRFAGCLLLALAVPAQAATYAITELGTLGGSFSFAYGVNDEAEVVGTSNVPGADNAHAFLYRDGRMWDLNDPADAASRGWILSCARAINASGQIVGFGNVRGQTMAFLLTPDAWVRGGRPARPGGPIAGLVSR